MMNSVRVHFKSSRGVLKFIEYHHKSFSARESSKCKLWFVFVVGLDLTCKKAKLCVVISFIMNLLDAGGLFFE